MAKNTTESLLDLISASDEASKESSTPSGSVTPSSELTPDQLRIRELEDQLAKANAKKVTEVEPEFEEASSEDRILIHFVTDGFTANGAMWYQGQEVEFDLKGQAYQDTLDREGKSWIHLSENDQIRKWGKVYFRRGAWPFERYEEPEVAAKEASRRRAAPIISV